MYRSLLKPLFFLIAPERAHFLVMFLFRLAGYIPGAKVLFRALYQTEDVRLARKAFGLTFPNPVGLAAGFDKDGRYYRQMARLGFGFLELGTVTPRPQPGNPRPRLFRLPADEALLNRMGFNNEGVEALVRRLRTRNTGKVIIGGNIGKNKTTPNEEAVGDYTFCFEQLYPHVDYFVVNVSSPNTPNLRDLQEKEPLTKLLAQLQELNRQKPTPKPILLKIAPDLTEGQLDDIIEIVEQTQIAGVIATNTTVSREGLRTSASQVEKLGAGGISGKPVGQRSTEVIRYLSKASQGKWTIIGVGGIHSAEDALEKLAAGATLVQVYTGLIYEGPRLIRRIHRALLNQS